MKGKVKRVVSGVLSAMTLLVSAVQPALVYASETGTLGYEAEFPAFEQVKDRLDMDEAVTAEDLEVEADGSFDAKNDFSGITFDAEKVKVKFHEAADRSGSRFDGKRTGSYRAVYFVKPSSGHPSYHVCRNIVVKKPAAENQAEKNPDSSDRSGRQEDAGSGDEEDGSDQEPSYGLETVTEDGSDPDGRNDAAKTGEEDILAADEDVDQAGTETGLTVEEAMSQAGEQGIDLLAMEEGESAVFYASAGERAEEKVTVTRGDCFRYADFGLGTYLTYRYTVRFGDVAATAYCVQPSKDSPDSGTFNITVLFLNTAAEKQELDNAVFQTGGIAQKYNCSLRRLDYMQEQGLMSSLPLGLNLVPVKRALTTTSTAIFVPFTTQELFMAGESLYYGLNALSNNMIMVDRK